MTMTADPSALNGDLKRQASALFRTKRTWSFALPLIVLAYLTYAFFAFDVPGLIRTASPENGQTLLRDSYSYKTHVTRDNRSAEVSIAVEGERKGAYPEGASPDWVTLGEVTEIRLAGGGLVTFGPEEVSYDIPGYGLVTARPGDGGANATFPPGDLPEWINASKNRVAITTDEGRLTITRNRTELFRYTTGWELFFFTLDSPYHGKGPGELLSLALNGEAAGIWHDFWYNPMWMHASVAWALFETVLMAFLGTFGAAIVALPLAFLAAKNFAPLMLVRQAFRRLFDLFRGVDALIWTIVLARAFGPGPLTGALAILVTDTGSFGKMFSEALENVDGKQIEGLSSVGAKPVQRYRFGVIPQVTPVLLSQVLYFFESNTRSATVIGAITGGGIGLLLTQAMITQKDWEEVTYYIVLVVLMVFAMDWFSGWVRRRLIAGDGEGH
ncbi:phosphonate ABC transporter, permease protein PhnE [Primorskyibacter flagellatus]|uniref:Phosphonate ABC transporter, permease protein PhnE n=1 Tax=Primorskyibacter flagellatus TaxID=1387277 RepID=A0A917EBB4_9RHOB|nr:phosphonate ABC transporter, permease protein PhnE [Primorskyibacter flagellatus]GGE20923.1 phosphonate ABC transporter, permease protein PhnE [Primorskyibacter flagellatus]